MLYIIYVMHIIWIDYMFPFSTEGGGGCLQYSSLATTLNPVVYYETIKRELNKRLTYECRCDERLKAEPERSTRVVAFSYRKRLLAYLHACVRKGCALCYVVVVRQTRW
jgi:hypothetical protein